MTKPRPIAATLAMCDEVERRDKRMTPGPWTYDDGNVFSEPLSMARHDAIIHNLTNRTNQIPVPGAGDERVYGFVCTTTQDDPFNDTDDEDIAAMRNLAPALAARLRVVMEVWPLVDDLHAAREEHGIGSESALIAYRKLMTCHRAATAKLEAMS